MKKDNLLRRILVVVITIILYDIICIGGVNK